MTQKPSTLPEILKREDFTRELSRAAQISHECQGEAHFIVYLTEDNRIKVNQAIAGVKKLNPIAEMMSEGELTDDHYDHLSPDESSPGYQHEEGKGGHIAQFGRSLIRVHFHPPKGLLIPSPGDISTTNKTRSQNDALSELMCSKDSAFIEYANPIEVVGHIIDDDPNSYQLLAFQGATDKPIDFDHDFTTEVAERLNKISGEDILPRVYAICGFGEHFRNADEFSQFLNSIGLHKSGVFKVSNGNFSDLDRMQMFEPLLRRETLENDDEDDFGEDIDDH
ncbi:MAG: hypothetical protein HQ580_00925 [Planctomycetes bacterium]|nr:hypothetical protein [Planctomycetota bacterium]